MFQVWTDPQTGSTACSTCLCADEGDVTLITSNLSESSGVSSPLTTLSTDFNLSLKVCEAPDYHSCLPSWLIGWEVVIHSWYYWDFEAKIFTSISLVAVIIQGNQHYLIRFGCSWWLLIILETVNMVVIPYNRCAGSGKYPLTSSHFLRWRRCERDRRKQELCPVSQRLH